MREQSARALQIAQWLESHPAVERVLHPGLASHPQHALAMRQQNGQGGAVITFVVKGGREEAFSYGELIKFTVFNRSSGAVSYKFKDKGQLFVRIFDSVNVISI